MRVTLLRQLLQIVASKLGAVHPLPRRRVETSTSRMSVEMQSTCHTHSSSFFGSDLPTAVTYTAHSFVMLRTGNMGIILVSSGSSGMSPKENTQLNAQSDIWMSWSCQMVMVTREGSLWPWSSMVMNLRVSSTQQMEECAAGTPRPLMKDLMGRIWGNSTKQNWGQADHRLLQINIPWSKSDQHRPILWNTETVSAQNV